jgi:hypothetical protein
MKRLMNWLRGSPERSESAPIRETAPLVVELKGAVPFKLSEHIQETNGFPFLDWTAVDDWIAEIAIPDLQAKAWSACERGWLLHMRDALGSQYRYDETSSAAIISSLDPKSVRTTLEFIEKTLKRIVIVMEELVSVPAWGKDILLVMDDEETYYEYVSNYGPEAGEFALSAGTFISRGCSHFVTCKDSLRSIEPTIAHEMTHSCVAHLPLPLWLNEGLAVNMERRLTGYVNTLYTPHEMHEKHLSFWGPEEIQQFWQGRSYRRTDDGNMLSYDLGRILVEHFGGNWAIFKKFVLAAHWEDGGAEAARKHLGIELGEAVAAMLGKADFHPCEWNPRPDIWDRGSDEAQPQDSHLT